MPYKSKAQKKLMLAAAHDQAFSRKVGVPMKTAKKFVADSKAAKKKGY